jgi:hypothetical protein
MSYKTVQKGTHYVTVCDSKSMRHFLTSLLLHSNAQPATFNTAHCCPMFLFLTAA